MSEMIMVYRLPKKLTDGYCFGGGTPITFTNLDWFGARNPSLEDHDISQTEIEEFIKSKAYYSDDQSFLVLDDRPGRTFVIPAAIHSRA